MRILRLGMGTGLLIALSSLSWAAQSGSTINGPSLGFVTNEDGTAIWPLLGILGASVPGPALVLPESIVHAAISPQQDYALALAGERAEPVIVHLDASNPGVVPLAGGRPNASLIAISPTGAAAALYQRESKFLQLVSGLPANPQIAYQFDASSLGGNIRDIAVSDDAKLALVTVGDESRRFWVIDAKGSVSPVTAAQPSRMAFIAKRPDALIADDASHEVFVLQGLDLNPVRLPGIVLREDARPISAVTASSDGQYHFRGTAGFRRHHHNGRRGSNHHRRVLPLQADSFLAIERRLPVSTERPVEWTDDGARCVLLKPENGDHPAGSECICREGE